MTRRSRAVAVTVTAVLALPMLAGCGYSFEADVPNPCTLITADQLTEVLVLEFDGGVPKPDYSNDHQSVCQWSRAGDERQFIQVLVASDVERFEAERDEADGGTGATADHEVDGADRAYYGVSGSLIGMVVDGYFVSIANYTAAPGSRLDTTTDVAAIIASNLAAAESS